MTIKPYFGWGFYWQGNLEMTHLVAWRRKDLIREVEEFMGDPWRKIHRQGGRAIKITIQPR